MTPPGHPARARFPLRDRPGIVWLTLAAVVGVAHALVPGAGWLLVHLVLLGALTHSALVWSAHFTRALLRTPETDRTRRAQERRILLLLSGCSGVFVGVPAGWWLLTLLGAIGVATAVAWHAGVLWHDLRHALPGRFRVTVHAYLVAAAFLPLGAGLGVWLARGHGDEWHGRLVVAHSMVMALGWLGLTVTGTLVTLWPTMLRTRMDDRAERLARQALPLLAAATLTVASAAVAGSRTATAAGLLAYVVGLLWWGRALVAPARKAPPRTVATVSVLAATAWALVAIALVAARLLRSGSWAGVGDDGYDAVAAVVAVGFGLQLLIGALSHLIPAVLGGGPSVVRAASARFDRVWVGRVLALNLGLILWLVLDPSSSARTTVAAVVLLAAGSFVPLLLAAVAAAVRARRALLAETAAREDGGTPAAQSPGPAASRTGEVGAALAALALAVAVGGAAGSPTSVGGAPVADSTGHTTRVRVEAHEMHFTPSSIDVPVGERLVVDLVNVDRGSPHDLSFGVGRTTPRVMPGAGATLDVGTVAADEEGWCTIVGHRQMGMVLTVRAIPRSEARSGHASTTGVPDRTALPAFTDGFRAVEAALTPLVPGRTHRVTLRVVEADLEVAPGVRQRRWTFAGSVPGPTLHGRVGDTFVVTLVNDGSMGHSVDFHAGERAPDVVMRTIPPGGRLTYTFTARRAGAWLYHCSTMPMSAHIAAGMVGAVVIEPPDLPAVDRSFVLVQSEVYLDGDGRRQPAAVDAGAAAAAAAPDLVTFNGVAGQYAARPLTAAPGDRVRLWVVDAGPNRESAFHVVGAQFDTMWSEGHYLLRRGRDALGGTSGGAQVLALAPGSGGFVELVAREPGIYPFVSHAMADAERGARGLLRIGP